MNIIDNIELIEGTSDITINFYARMKGTKTRGICQCEQVYHQQKKHPI